MGVSLAAVVAVVVAWLAFAAAGTTRPAGKSGGSALLLDLAVAEYPGRTAGQVAERFARAVENRSNGSIRVEITYWPTTLAVGTPSGRVEAGAARAVRADLVQLAVLPSYALTAQGASTLRALQAPFVLTSTASAARATEPPLADRLQAGLGRLGLTGLGWRRTARCARSASSRRW